MTSRCIIGDCRDELPRLDAGSVQTCVTSPPYWGLRDYGAGGQIGLEASLAEYLDELVGVFREVRRVLRDDGSLWLNLGDKYVGGGGGGQGKNGWVADKTAARTGVRRMRDTNVAGLKPKDLIGLPWRVAFALQSDGWWLRSDVVWHKPTCMPLSVTDRPTTAHEYVFLLTKRQRYFYDAEAVAEQAASAPCDASAKRNRRSVWRIQSTPHHGDHPAAYPVELAKLCVAAGSSPTACGTCGAPWRRVVEYERAPVTDRGRRLAEAHTARVPGYEGGVHSTTLGQDVVRRRTVGWKPSCEHEDDSGSCVVIDPFFGSGTTGAAAEELGRDWIGIELNPKYAADIAARTAQRSLRLRA